MTSWDGNSHYGRSCQSAPSSRKTSPILKRTSRTPNTSPNRPVAMSSPRPSAGATSGVPSYMSSVKERRSRSTIDTSGEDSCARYRHHRSPEPDPCDGPMRYEVRTCDDDVKCDLKGFYENLLRGKDDIIRKMEKKVDGLHREIASVRQMKDREIDMLRQSLENNTRAAECDFEKRLNESLAEAEKQKVYMHREHTRRAQELLETTNKRLQKMEESYGDRISYLTRMVDELECKLTTLSKDMEQVLHLKKHLKDERDHFEAEVCCLQEQNSSLDCRLKEVMHDYEAAKDRLCQLEMEKAQLEEKSSKVLEDLRKRLECEIQMMREKNEEDELQSKCKIAALEQDICQLKSELKKTQECNAHRIQELECQHQQNTQCMEQQHKKQMHEMQHEIDVMIREYGSRTNTMEMSLCDKERQINQLKTQMQCQTKEYEEKLQQERECACQLEREVRSRDAKVQSLCDQLNCLEAQRQQQLEEVCRQLEEHKECSMREIRELNSKLEHAMRLAELQAEDAARHLEEEKRCWDEKVGKVSHQLQQSICMYEQETGNLTKRIEEEQSLRCRQVHELNDQLQKCKNAQQQQLENHRCHLKEEKWQFHVQLQDLTKEVDHYRCLCEKQSQDYAVQIEEKERLHYDQIAQIRCQYELDKEELVKRYQKEMESLKRDPQNYVRCLEDRFTTLLTETEDKAWKKEQENLQTIAELEAQIHQLRCNLSEQSLSSCPPPCTPCPQAHSTMRRHSAADSMMHECSCTSECDCSRHRTY